MKKITTALLVLAIATGAFAQTKLDKNFTGVKEIRIKLVSGDCRISKASGQAISVNLQHTYTENFEPEMSQSGDKLTLKELFGSGSSRGSSSWTVQIPDGVSVVFSSASGSFSASSVDFDLDARSGSGGITLENVKGDIKGTTGSGDIELTNYAGEIKANTGSGNVQIYRCKGDLSVTSGSGDVRIRDSQAKFSANSGSGTVHSRGISLEGDSRFNSGSGDSEILLASSPKYDISVSSGSGDAALDFGGNKIEGEIVMKASKARGTIHAPFEFDRTEEISRGGNDVVVEKTVVKGNANVKILVGTGSGDASIKE
ncbi:MAG: DUF4097 family beta strand repeat-containing protein [Cyclobacteriaceae bacterium]